MKIKKNFSFGVITAMLIYWAYVAVNHEYMPAWQALVVLILCQPIRIGKYIYSIFGGENKGGGVISIISIYQESYSGNSISLIAIRQISDMNCFTLLLIGGQISNKDSISILGFGFQVSETSSVINIIGIVIQISLKVSGQVLGLAAQWSTELSDQLVGLSFQKAKKEVRHRLGLTIQISEKAKSLLGIRPYVKAEDIGISPLVIDIFVPKQIIPKEVVPE